MSQSPLCVVSLPLCQSIITEGFTCLSSLTSIWELNACSTSINDKGFRTLRTSHSLFETLQVNNRPSIHVPLYSKRAFDSCGFPPLSTPIKCCLLLSAPLHDAIAIQNEFDPVGKPASRRCSHPSSREMALKKGRELWEVEIKCSVATRTNVTPSKQANSKSNQQDSKAFAQYTPHSKDKTSSISKK